MIARSRKRRGQAAKNGPVVVLHLASLPMHEVARALHLASKRRANRLVTKTDSQDRRLPGHVTNQLNANASVLRRARAGRDHDVVWLEMLDLRRRNLIVAAHLDLGPKLTEVLHEVVGERIVIVEYKDHGRADSLAELRP